MQMLLRAILESLKDLEQSNTKTVQSTASENVQSAASDAASKENNVVKDCNGVNDVTSGPDVQSMSACVTRISDNHTTDCSGEANASEMQSEQNGSVNGTAPVRASEPQASTQITSEKTALVEPHKPTQNVKGEDGTRATLVVQKSRTGGLIDGLTQKWGSFFKNND
jgi:hypothetical protein